MLKAIRYAVLTTAAALSLHCFAAGTLPEETPYSAVIDDVLDVVPVGRGDALNATLKLSAEVPNSSAKVLLRGVGSYWTDVLIQVDPVSPTPEGQAVRRGAPTKYLRLQWSPSRAGFQANRLKGSVLQEILFPYSLKVTAVRDLGSVGGRDFHNIELSFEGVVPNDYATLVADFGEGAFRRELLPDHEGLRGHGSHVLDLQWMLPEAAKLVGQTVRVYSPRLPEVYRGR